MPDVLDWRTDDHRAILQAAVVQLRQGRLVALPTEAGYEAVASALHPEAVQALRDLVGPSELLTVVLGEAGEVFDWLPHLRGVAVRLIRAFWPGPLTIVSEDGAYAGLGRHLPSEVQRQCRLPTRSGLRLPDHDWPTPLRRMLAGPLLGAPLPGFPREISQIGAGRDQLSLIIDGGPTALAQPPSIVQIIHQWPTPSRVGAIPWTDVEAAAACHLVFVCTGNTCRSPLAEGLCRALLSAKVASAGGKWRNGCFRIQSAGMAAGPGNPATGEAVAIAHSYGADLSGHRSQPLSVEQLSRADRVFTMTWSQLGLLHSLRVPIGPSPQLLSPQGFDVDDPIGGASEVYRACAEQIWQYLNERLPELLEC